MIGAAETLPPPGRIQPIYLEGKLLPLAAPWAQELGLQDGQVIQATVSSSGSDMSLLLQGKSIDVPDAMASGLMAGRSIWLRVQANPQGDWGLQPLAQPEAPSPPSALISRLSSLLFRPNEDSVGELLSGSKMAELLHTLARSDLQTQWRALQISPNHLSADALRLALQGALGHEAWFSRGKTNPGADLKQFLRNLLKALDASPEDHKVERSQLQQSIDSLESHQVQALQAQIQNEVMFSLTLPFVGGDSATLVFRRTAAPNDGRAPAFTVNVHSKSADLGPVWLQTRLTGNDQVDLTMWAQMQSVADQARARQNDLATELNSAGLRLTAFQVIHGARPTQEREWTPSGRGLVVDISA